MRLIVHVFLGIALKEEEKNALLITTWGHVGNSNWPIKCETSIAEQIASLKIELTMINKLITSHSWCFSTNACKASA